MPRPCLFQCQTTTSNTGGNGKGTCLNTIGNNPVSSTVKAGNSLDHDGISAMTADLCSHGIQAISQIRNFWLTRRINQFGTTLGKYCRHDGIFGRANRHHRKHNTSTGQALRRTRLYVSISKLDNCAECLHRADMQINWPGADGTTTWQRDTRFTIAGQQRSQNKDGGPHFAHQVVRRVKR